MKNAPDKLAEQLRSLPDSPGVYQYFDEEGKILYVGKAINLRKRVLSYFVKNHDRAKTAMLVRRIADIKYIIVETELDALLLENNLIKKYQPRYNVALKDDKTFPWICIKNERFPRVFHTRRLLRDGSKYFGPYANVKMMHALLDLIHKLYPTRNCNLNLNEENINRKKYRVCLEYHIGNCRGPCEGLQTEQEYNESVARMEEIIRGNFTEPLKHLKALMLDYAGKMEFEKAQLIKEKVDILENYRSRSTVVSPSITNVDVCSITSDEDTAFVNYLKVMNGAIVLGHTIELKKKIEENQEELLQMAIAEFRNRFQSDSKEIIVQFSPGIEIPGVEFVIPQRGDKKKLLDLSARNVEYYRKEKERQQSLVDPERHTRRILATMMKDLRLQVEPRHIECFDNSNIQGAYPVAAMTVFKDARPSKKDYRHFNIKTVEGPDDFASMEEVIYRRYKRLLEEKQELPQLIVIDGGKGQLSAALHSLEKLDLRGKIGIIGIAKRLEEIYYPGDSMPMYLDKKSETLRIIQQIRDEAHRFGITHHRKRREKGTIKTELTEIRGISHTTAQALLRVFKSVKQIKLADQEALISAVGKAKGHLVYAHFHPTSGSPVPEPGTA
ncbi:MAG TPA: excinuclease ABC subunit UvrC [Bacteroidia bacterium]|jgi:excinuclease ABC subunit C|nr:excinuclease ABC subunit UvrC [Bacteroidia bacterium]